MRRQTKIVCTIGPATSGEAKLAALVEAGMNVVRLNFAHGNHAQHGVVLARIRALAAQLDTPIAVLQDLAGCRPRSKPATRFSSPMEPSSSASSA
jgi:pyruvate kinase